MIDILCVENDFIASYVLEKQIERLGYRMIGKATTGEKAIEQAMELKPDLVMMDIHLDGSIDGIVTAQFLTGDLNIPVVFVTALQDPEIRRKALKLNSVAYINKPVQLKTLRLAIESIFPNVKMKRILLVEDDYIISMLLEKQIRRMGYEVAGKVDSGEKALEFIRDEKPDLVLMDIELKGDIDGIDTVRQMREFSKAPVIYLTGNANEKTRLQAEDTKPEGFLVKPVDMEVLKQQIRQIVEKDTVS
jgi:two-component system, response regulator PdtaR